MCLICSFRAKHLLWIAVMLLMAALSGAFCDWEYGHTFDTGEECRRVNTAILSPGGMRMETKPSPDEHIRCAAVERMWLHYFNNSLLHMGLISPEEHRKLQLQIHVRKAPPQQQ